ncbi:antitoxin VbhA family protein [Rhodococcus sp. NPDC058521]|uniref:antitoxin VbhA family protein n=1 Tax=Rhodococcus sp. NPDC058521 TaxID=3346536 RepID=UPI00364C1581
MTRSHVKRDVEEVIAAVDAGHTMAGMPLTEFDREMMRRQASGEFTGDEAVRIGLDQILGKSPKK